MEEAIKLDFNQILFIINNAQNNNFWFEKYKHDFDKNIVFDQNNHYASIYADKYAEMEGTKIKKLFDKLNNLQKGSMLTRDEYKIISNYIYKNNGLPVTDPYVFKLIKHAVMYNDSNILVLLLSVLNSNREYLNYKFIQEELRDGIITTSKTNNLTMFEPLSKFMQYETLILNESFITAIKNNSVDIVKYFLNNQVKSVEGLIIASKEYTNIDILKLLLAYNLYNQEDLSIALTRITNDSEFNKYKKAAQILVDCGGYIIDENHDQVLSKKGLIKNPTIYYVDRSNDVTSCGDQTDFATTETFMELYKEDQNILSYIVKVTTQTPAGNFILQCFDSRKLVEFWNTQNKNKAPDQKTYQNPMATDSKFCLSDVEYIIEKSGK